MSFLSHKTKIKHFKPEDHTTIIIEIFYYNNEYTHAVANLTVYF